MKKYFSIWCLTILLLVGCKGPKKEILASSYSPYIVDMSLSEATDSHAALSIARFVKLQTTDKSLINQVSKVIPYKNRLFLLSAIPQNSVLIFASDGTFLAKINKGRADNEIFYPTDISIDESREQLRILDHYRNVKIFTLDGKYVSQYALSAPQYNMESVGNDGTSLFYSLNFSAKNEYTGYFGCDGKKLHGVYKSPYAGQGYINPGNLLKYNQDSTLLCPMFSDTIYLFSASNQTIAPCFVFDFKGKSANAGGKVEKYLHIDDYGDAIRGGNLYSGPRCVHFISNKLYFNFHSRPDAFYIFDTQTQKLNSYLKMFDELPNYYNKIGQTDEFIICAYDAEWLQSHFRKNPPESPIGRDIAAHCRNEEDNPILIFAKPE